MPKVRKEIPELEKLVQVGRKKVVRYEEGAQLYSMNNSLAEVHPELITEWSEKNLPLTHDDITFGSNKKVWWKGTCGHEWQTSVKARSNGEKCPICSGARVIAGINDLATLEPLLAKQWSKKNKIKPTEVSIGSLPHRFKKEFLWGRGRALSLRMISVIYTQQVQKWRCEKTQSSFFTSPITTMGQLICGRMVWLKRGAAS